MDKKMLKKKTTNKKNDKMPMPKMKGGFKKKGKKLPKVKQLKPIGKKK